MMIWAIVGPLVTGLAAVPLSACLLTRGTWQIRRPRRALAAWALTGALGLVVTIVAVLVASALSLSTSSAGAPIEGLALTLIAWAGLGGLGIAGSLTQLRRVDLGEEDDDRPSITELLSHAADRLLADGHHHRRGDRGPALCGRGYTGHAVNDFRLARCPARTAALLPIRCSRP